MTTGWTQNIRSNTEFCFVGNLESWDNNLRFSHKKDPLDWTHQKVMQCND